MFYMILHLPYQYISRAAGGYCHHSILQYIIILLLKLSPVPFFKHNIITGTGGQHNNVSCIYITYII